MATREDIFKIAKLARIRIREEELSKVEAKFTAILESFQFLSEAETEGVEPMFHAMDSLKLRVDEPEEPLDRGELLRNAPDQFEGSFRIPRVVGSDE